MFDLHTNGHHGFGCDMASIYAICTKFSQYVFRRIFTLFTDMDLYVGRCLCILEKKHLAIEFIVRKLPIKAAVFVHTFIQILLIAFALIVLVLGGSKAVITTMEQSSAALGIPVGFVYLSLPVAGILIIGYNLAGLYESLHEFNSKQKSGDDVKKQQRCD